MEKRDSSRLRRCFLSVSGAVLCVVVTGIAIATSDEESMPHPALLSLFALGLLLVFLGSSGAPVRRSSGRLLGGRAVEDHDAKDQDDPVDLDLFLG